MASGLVYLPEDRQVSGLFLDAPVRWNTVMFNQPSWWQQGKREAAVVERYHRALGIKLADGDQPVRTLSGGNQQKVVIGRSLLTNPKVLFLDEPTRGIDVGAKADVFRMMVQLSEQGIAVVFSTSDLKEIMAVSDRILVMSGGKLTADIVRDRAEESALVTASAQGF